MLYITTPSELTSSITESSHKGAVTSSHLRTVCEAGGRTGVSVGLRGKHNPPFSHSPHHISPVQKHHYQGTHTAPTGLLLASEDYASSTQGSS